MSVKYHQHALLRMLERGTTKSEIEYTIAHGDTFEAKYGRTGFKHTFAYDDIWLGKHYSLKQVEVYTVEEGTDRLVISVITKFF